MIEPRLETADGRAALRKRFWLSSTSGEISRHLAAALDALDASDAALAGYQAECFEVEQRLGHALGYPIMGPEVGGEGQHVCVGDHAPGTLAAEAAGRITALAEARAAEVERVATHLRLWLDRTAAEWAREDQHMARWIRTFASGVDREISALRDPGE